MQSLCNQERFFATFFLFFLLFGQPACISLYAAGEIVLSCFARLMPACLRRLMLATREFLGAAGFFFVDDFFLAVLAAGFFLVVFLAIGSVLNWFLDL